MRGLNMEIDWRTVQLFLDDSGVSEVEIDAEDSSTMKCSCKVFFKSSKCKHTKYVKSEIENNDGNYAIKVPVDIDDDEAWEAMSSSETFRKFIIKYGKVEVID
jgi:metal-sulfur cluster biosynthetic enzyme